MRHICLNIVLYFALSACAAALTPSLFSVGDSAPKDIRALAVRAEAGDRDAMLALAHAYEQGDGVPLSLENAAHIYRFLATPVSGQRGIYQPGIGGGIGIVTTVDMGPSHPGDAEAQYRLAQLYAAGRGVRENKRKAEALFRRAAAQGHGAAAATLDRDHPGQATDDKEKHED